MPALLAAEAVGLITASRGAATIKREDQKLYPVRMGTPVYVQDFITLSPQALVKITFIDRSTISLTGGANLLVKNFVFKESKEAISHLEVKRGTFSFLAGEIARMAPENYQIETETATIGIRGSGGIGVTSAKRLLITTLPGHILDIHSRTGQRRIVAVPTTGLQVDASGACMPFALTQNLLTPHSYALIPEKILPQTPLLPRPYRSPDMPCNGEARLSSRRVQLIHIAQASRPKKRGQELMDEPEPSSATPSLQRLAAKQRAEATSKEKKLS